MRDYSKVSPRRWTGDTGRALRGDLEAQVVVDYLLTCQHANMLGVYYLPIAYLSVDTGIPFEGASKGLRRAIEVGFCSYDEAAEVVWVHNMARDQVGDALKANDLRVAGVQREYDSLPNNAFLGRFFDTYGASFRMTNRREPKPLPSPLIAPSKALPSQEQEQEQEQENEKENLETPSPAEAPPPPQPPEPPAGSGEPALSSSGSGDRQEPEPPVLVPSEPTRRAPVQAVFAAYLAGWKRNARSATGGRPPVLNEKRRRLVQARLRDGHDVEQLTLAADGVWRSAWNVENGRTSFDLAMRDSEHVERFAALGVLTGAPVQREADLEPSSLEPSARLQAFIAARESGTTDAETVAASGDALSLFESIGVAS